MATSKALSRRFVFKICHNIELLQFVLVLLGPICSCSPRTFRLSFLCNYVGLLSRHFGVRDDLGIIWIHTLDEFYSTFLIRIIGFSGFFKILAINGFDLFTTSFNPIAMIELNRFPDKPSRVSDS